MKNNSDEIPASEDVKKICEIGEEIFEASLDPDQAKSDQENIYKLINIDTQTILIEKNKGSIIGWTISIPTTSDDMNMFLSGEISESDLFDRSTENIRFEALYFMAVVVLPAFRGQGVAKKIAASQLAYFLQEYPSISQIYAWQWSEGGQGLVNSLSKDFDILIRKIE